MRCGLQIDTIDTDVLVIGAGAAGLRAVLAARENGSVKMSF